MSERTVKVRLSAQVQEYLAGMAQAEQATKRTSDEAAKLADRRQAMQTLGTGMVAVGGAITAVGLAALKTGIEYNTLQQTSRAALLTMLGSTEAVNSQMDKLDAFARTSPFAKSTFIEAQQQMLAFGIETEKVIPYLDAVQNAVAAAGGSNAEIAGIVATMSKIQSSSKITAQDLNEFGNRGVNAAELIGSQMGLTGAEIREKITAGSLDATEALDALATGMAENFAGAADNVKDTFDGAMDRVKAAWRDFGAELAKPLVDPEGGGALVDFLNGLADAMRKFESMPEPLKIAVTTITGLTGAALLLGGTMMLAVPKIVEFRAALAIMESTGGRLYSTLGAVGRAATAVGIALAAAAAVKGLASLLHDNALSADELTTALKQISYEAGITAESLDEMISVTGSGGAAISGFGQALDTLDQNGFLQFLDKGASLFGVFDSDAGLAKDAVNNLSVALSGFVSSGDFERLADNFKAAADSASEYGFEAIDVLNSMPALKAQLVEVAEAQGIAATDANVLKVAFNEVEIATDKTSGALDGVADAHGDAADAVEDHIPTLQQIAGVAREVESAFAELAGEIQGFGSTSIDAGRAAIKFEEEISNLAKHLGEAEATLDRGTEAGRENEASLYDLAEAANKAAGAAYEAGESQETVNAILDRGREALGNAARAFGATKEEAREYQEQLLATPEDIETYIKLHGVAEAEAELANLARNRVTILGIETQEWRAPMLPSTEGADGFIEAYSRGGFAEGIYKGGAPIHKFAEPETGWEAYISGKPSERARNREIWVETGNRLGMNQGQQASAPPVVYVQNPFTGEYLLARTRVVADQVVSDRSGSGSVGSIKSSTLR